MTGVFLYVRVLPSFPTPAQRGASVTAIRSKM
jgi:hypothetical protein